MKRTKSQSILNSLILICTLAGIVTMLYLNGKKGECFLGPLYGYAAMYKGSNVEFHLAGYQ